VTDATRARHTRGVILMLAAVGAFAIMDALMKQLATRYPALQVASLRGLSSLPFLLLSLIGSGRWHLLRPVNVRLHILRGALAIFMLWGFVWSLDRGSMSATYAVFMCAPLLVVGAATFVLKERVDAHRIGAIVAGLAGVMIMLNPTAEGLATAAGLASLAAAFAYAFQVVTVRLLARTDSTPSMVFWFLVIVGIGAGLLAAPDWVSVRASDVSWILAIGLAGYVGQHLITEAFRLAPASLVAPFEYTALVWAVGIDWVVWTVLPTARLLTGSAIVVSAGLYVLYRERAR